MKFKTRTISLKGSVTVLTLTYIDKNTILVEIAKNSSGSIDAGAIKQLRDIVKEECKNIVLCEYDVTQSQLRIFSKSKEEKYQMQYKVGKNNFIYISD